jgi:hypothetical protein
MRVCDSLKSLLFGLGLDRCFVGWLVGWLVGWSLGIIKSNGMAWNGME